MVDVPEHRFTEDQTAELIKLLGTNAANLPTMQGKGLLDPAGWFLRSLVLQNYPPSSQIDKSLEQIESAASRLRRNLSNPLVWPYMRMAAGDIVEDDHTLDTAVAAVENLRRWSQEARGIVRRNDETKRKDRPTKGKGKSKGLPKRSAMRVLIHRLALLWMHTHKGIRPTVSVNRDGTSGGKFIRFAQSYIKAMRNQTTDKHRRHAGNIEEELNVTANAIASHLRFFLARLPRRS